MNVNIFAGAAIAIAALGAVRADASMIIGAPIIVPSDNVMVTVTFESSEAAYTGNLYFLGAGNEQGLTNSASDSDDMGLGQFLFANHNAIAQASILDGDFHAGQVLYFAYNLIAPEHVAGDLFRGDLDSGRNQFAWDADPQGLGGTLHIEDLHPGDADYDGDFNDLVVTITFTQVPTPGSFVLMGAGLLVMLSKRRR